MKRKTNNFSTYQQSMFNKYSIDESCLQTGKQRRACLELLEKIDTNQELDEKTMIEKIGAAFQGSGLHKKVASCVTVAALLAALQSTPAMALASNDHQPKTETAYSQVIADDSDVSMDSDSYLDMRAPTAAQDIKSASLHLFSNPVFANAFEPMHNSGVLVDDDSDVAYMAALESKTLTVIDTDLVDWEILRDAVNEGEVLLLEDDANPLDAILVKLQEMGTVDCLNIVSHGESGKLKFENSVIDSEALEANKDKWTEISSHLSSDGDIQLYGCNIAKDDAGKAFIEKLAQVTGADVAASINPTGSESKGGDWTLEAVVGDVTGNLPFAKDSIAKFMSILFPSTPASHQFTFTGTAGTYTFIDGGDNLNNNYFTVSGTEDTIIKPMGIVDSSANMYTKVVRGNLRIKVSAAESNLKSFELEDLSINNNLAGYDFTNLKIIGHKADGSGNVESGAISSLSLGTTAILSTFGSEGNFNGVQLDYFTIEGIGTDYGAQYLMFNSFTVSSMTAPGPNAPTVTSPAAATNDTKPTWEWATGGDGNGTFRYKLDSSDFTSGATEPTEASYTPTTALSEGEHTLYVQERDDAGHWSPSGSCAVTVDTTAPTAPTVTSSLAATNDATPTWTWTAGGGGNGAFRYKLDSSDFTSGTTETTTASYTQLTDLSEGSHTLYVQERDAAGNWSSSGSYAITVDTNGPDITFSGIALSADTGTSNTDFITKTADQTITATLSGAPAGTDKVYGSLDNGANWTDITGKVSETTLTWDGVTLAGSSTLQLKVTDAAGNDGTVKSQAYVLDTTGPAISFSSLAFSDDTGTSSTDFITKTAAQTITATLSGAPAGSDKVYGSLDNGTTWTDITAKVSETSLTWDSVTLTGSNTLMLKVVDNAGNDGTVKSQTYVLATTAPTTPVITTLAQTVNANSITIAGTAEAGSTITITGGLATATGTTTAGGSYSVSVSLTQDAANTLAVKATDAAGNSSGTASVVITEDSTGPAIPVITTAAQTLNANSITIAGTAEAGSTISITGGSATATGTATGGNYSIIVGLKQNEVNTLVVKATDAVGNDSGTASVAITEDSTAPTITFSSLVFSADTGTSSTDFITKTAAQTITATLSGAPAGSDKVYGSLDNGANWSDITSKVSETSLTWDSVTLTGSNTLMLKVVDNAGNDGTVKSQTYVLATTAPTTPVITTLGQTVNANSITIAGTAEAGSTITITGGSATPTGTTTAGGSYSISVSLTQDAVNTLVVKATDAAGNDSGTASVVITEDSTAPTTPVITTAAQTLNADSITITGTAEAGATITITGGSATATGTTTAGGSYSIIVGLKQNEVNTLVVKATDAVGNDSGIASVAITEDSTAPSEPSVTSVKATTNDTTPTWTWITGGGGNGNYRYKLDSSDFTSGATETTTASYTPTALSEGEHTLYVQERNVAGNWSSSGNYKVTVDATAPLAPSQPDMTAGTDSGSSNTDNITSNTTPTFSGTAEAGSTVTLYDSDGTTVLGIATATGGTWNITSSALAAGSHSITAKATDAAGNVSEASSSLGVMIDTSTPTVVSVAVPGNGKYKAGETLNFTVNFSEAVVVTGTPELSITLDTGGTVSAAYVSGSSTPTALVFAYSILSGNADSTGVTVGTLSGTIKDAAGNDATLALNSIGSTANVLVDTTAPNIAVPAIAVSDLTSNSAKLTWTAATDPGTAQANLKYKVVYSTSDIISVDAADALSPTWTADIITANVTGLTASTDYYFAVIVKDEAGNKSLYTKVTGKTTAAVSGGGGSSTTTTSTVVEVNGQKQDAGTSSTSTTSGGQTVTTVKVDDTKLDKILESSGEKPTVTLPSSGSAVTVGELNGQTFKNMENKEATLEIKTDTVTYTLPASQINIDSVSAQLGSQVALKDIKVSVSIAEPKADTVKIIEDTANKGNYQLVVKPVEFTITCTSGDKTVDVSKFNGYVERTVAIPDGIDPSKITTGIVLNADGTFSHVPTQIVKIDGKYFAKINSLTNSTYSIIWNPIEFTDVVNYWAQAVINDMGSRMVVTGVGNGAYEPTRSITRAEFAAIAVRAMGLQKGTTESSFADVSMTDWFNGYVDTATAYSLITGYDSASYGPNDTITREQAMAILARAMKFTGLSVNLSDVEVNALISNYADGASVSAYAKASAAACIKTGIVNGTTATTISPKDYVTRAEVAVMVQRLLQKSGLI